jgi:2-keto-3-deoxy-L-rhamnonate aldolase RhmA
LCRVVEVGVSDAVVVSRSARLGPKSRGLAGGDAGVAERVIASVDGVDGVFIGPGDLAASLGHPGNPNAPDVIAAVEAAIGRVRVAGKPAGVLTTNPTFARRCIDLGTTFTAVGVDVGLLARGADTLARSFTA